MNMESDIPVVKRRSFIFLSILSLLLVLLLAGWSARLNLTERLITSQMKQAGLEDVTADIRQLALNKTQLSQLGFVVVNKTGRLTLNARGISIGYLPEKLINGNIDRLDIDRLNLHYKLNAEPLQNQNKTQPVIAIAQITKILAALRAALDEYLHLNELVIHHISLNGKVFAELDGKSLSLSSRKKGDAIDAELIFLNDRLDNRLDIIPGDTTDNKTDKTADKQSVDLPRLLITRLSKNELNAELRPVQVDGHLPATIKLEIKEAEISGNYQLSPPALRAWLQAAMGINDISALNKLSTSHNSTGNSNKNSNQDSYQNSYQSSDLIDKVSINFENSDRLYAALSSTSKHLTFDNYHAENIKLDIKLTYSSHDVNHSLKLLDGSYLNADKFSMGDNSVTGSRITLVGELSITDKNWKYNGSVNTKQLTADYQSQQLKLADIKVDITADAQLLQARGKFSPATLPGQFGFNLTHDLVSNIGSIAIRPTAAIEVNSEDHKLSKLLTAWHYPFDLYTGTIKLAADASWFNDKNPRLSIDVSLKGTGGNIKDIVFSGLSFDHQLEILPVIRSVHASELRLNTIDSGITISNTTTKLAATSSKRGPLPRFIVRQTRGEILGGSFTVDDMVYDLNRSKNKSLIRLKNIDMAEVVKTQQLESIKATGRLDGSLPVAIDKDGLSIADGGLKNNIHGGTIRYTPQGGTEQLKQNPITGIALNALKDFRYSDLQAEVNYRPDGELAISLALKGISPELDKNRPVHLNINTEQNLISLLKSLRFAQGVSDSIDEKVRRMYEQTQ